LIVIVLTNRATSDAIKNVVVIEGKLRVLAKPLDNKLLYANNYIILGKT